MRHGFDARIFDVVTLRDAGRVGEAEALFERALARALGEPPRWVWIATAVDVLNSLGRYGEALGLVGRWPRQAITTSAEERGADVIAAVNMAEAEYNRGAFGDAWRRLSGLDEAAAPHAFARAALRLQRAWVLAHGGDLLGDDGAKPRSAIEVWESVNLGDLPPSYHAEHHFTHAAARLAEKDTPGARGAVERGAAVAKRPSSARNAEILRARVAVAEGRLEDAERRLAAAAAHPHRRQGGDGLLLWGDVLRELGRGEEAKRAWALAARRDPESASAREARGRLADSPPLVPKSPRHHINLRRG